VALRRACQQGNQQQKGQDEFSGSHDLNNPSPNTLLSTRFTGLSRSHLSPWLASAIRCYASATHARNGLYAIKPRFCIRAALSH
jgi:hypothetical protein